MRHIFAGDDTGLLKKLGMTVTLEEDIISMPNVNPRKRAKKTAQEQFNTEDIEAALEGRIAEEDEVEAQIKREMEALKEESVVRQRPNVEF
jgi:ribosomal protein S13